jgi:predicted RNA binding protein YcfA (HicA-like mRNA interferase family)
VSRKQKRLEKLLQNQQDWMLQDLIVIALDYGFELRQGKGSHAVFTSPFGVSQAIPEHRPVKAVYAKKLLALIEEVIDHAAQS